MDRSVLFIYISQLLIIRSISRRKQRTYDKAIRRSDMGLNSSIRVIKYVVKRVITYKDSLSVLLLLVLSF